ncbi:MAG: hypothetical protein FWH28_08765 [Clostridiales bacterium]|nr:hypothetical protein [Clostridiales bacterium]
MSVNRAVMDIGTNACRLILVEINDEDEVTLVRQIRTTRIGEGLGQGRLHISRNAMDRTLAVLMEYKEMIEAYPVESVRLLGTQALREADNGHAFAAEVKEKTGFHLEIITGESEACLSYAGAVQGIKTIDASLSPLVLDIGAGSTELIWRMGGAEAEKETKQIKGVSAPVGCLRLLERPMNDGQILSALQDSWGIIENMDEKGSLTVLVAVGGTATTLGAIHLHMTDYDPEALLGLRLSDSIIKEQIVLLESMSAAERLALPGMMPGREDVLPWGLRILLAAMAHCHQESVMICDRDLLYGALYA